MNSDDAPREPVLPRLESAIGEQDETGVVITYGLACEIREIMLETMVIGTAVRSSDGALMKHLGVKFFGRAWSAVFVFDFPSATQANYAEALVDVDGARIVTRYPDACLGLHRDGTLRAFTTLDGRDVQSDVDVTLFR
jgi:hypothetical protein